MPRKKYPNISCTRGQVHTINKLFGYTIHIEPTVKSKLTNSEFIAMVADKLILKNKVL